MHYVFTREVFFDLSIKDCFSKKWISHEFSRTCMAGDAIRSVEKAYAIRFPDDNPGTLILRTDNGTQYTSKTFMDTLKTLGIGHEYIQKQTPEDKNQT
jgi:transposase InsO family protein